MLGVIRQMQGRVDEGIRYFERAVEIHPWKHETNARLASLYIRQRNFTAARPYLARCVKIRPRDPRMLAHLSLAQYGERRYEEGIETAQRWVELEPDAG